MQPAQRKLSQTLPSRPNPIKYGKDRRGNQRYQDRCTKKTFSFDQGNPKKAELIRKLRSCYRAGMPIRRAAGYLGRDKNTVAKYYRQFKTEALEPKS
jgi:transposase-like protein